MFKIKSLFSYLIVFLFSAFGMDSEDLTRRKDLQDFIGGYINAALELNCWRQERKVGEIIKLEQYGGQKQKEEHGKIIFISENEEVNPHDPNNLYVKILEKGGGTHVRKNVLTLVLKDLFTEESVDSYIKGGKLLLVEKESQKTGLFWDASEAKEKPILLSGSSSSQEKSKQLIHQESIKRQWFAKRYHDAGYSYRVIYVIAHELIHFMQNKKGDYDKLTHFNTDEKAIIDNLDLLEKYKSSFIRYISDIDTALLAIKLKQLQQTKGNDIEIGKLHTLILEKLSEEGGLREKDIDEFVQARFCAPN
jgi:hypothetical protein